MNDSLHKVMKIALIGLYRRETSCQVKIKGKEMVFYNDKKRPIHASINVDEATQTFVINSIRDAVYADIELNQADTTTLN